MCGVVGFGCGFEFARFKQFGEGDVDGSGHVAGTRLGCGAVEASGGTRVEDGCVGVLTLEGTVELHKEMGAQILGVGNQWNGILP